jgi:transposase
MLGPAKVRRLDELVITSLELLVPPDNPYRDLEAKLDLTFVRDWAGDLYAEGGRPSIDPVVFFKLQLILFFAGLRSERKLIETASLHLAHRWYLGYTLDEPLPDHSSLTRIRARLGVAIVQRFFERVVELCQEAGLVWGQELFFDGTKVRANADIDSLTPRFAQAAREHVTDLFAGDRAAGMDTASPEAQSEGRSTPGEDASPPPSIPASPASSDAPQPSEIPVAAGPEAEARLAAENQAQWKLLAEHRLDPKRPPSGPYRRIVDFRVSTTDPDAAPVGVGAVAKLGYHDHYVVDGGKARIIMGVLVTPADVQDNQPFLDLLDRARFRFHLHVRRAIADSKYATAENLRALAERGIRAYMPVVEYDKSSLFFQHKDFVYDPATNTYRCPQGPLCQ